MMKQNMNMILILSIALSGLNLVVQLVHHAKSFGGLGSGSTDSLSLHPNTAVTVSDRRKAMIAGGRSSSYRNNDKNNLRQSQSLVDTEESSVDDEEVVKPPPWT